MIGFWNSTGQEQHLSVRDNVDVITMMNSKARRKSRALTHRAPEQWLINNGVSRGEISGWPMRLWLNFYDPNW